MRVQDEGQEMNAKKAERQEEESAEWLDGQIMGRCNGEGWTSIMNGKEMAYNNKQ